MEYPLEPHKRPAARRWRPGLRRPRYDEAMESVAERLRWEERLAMLTLTPGGRVRLALALGERDIEAFRAAQDPPLTRREAATLLDRQRQTGRRESGCMRALLG